MSVIRSRTVLLALTFVAGLALPLLLGAGGRVAEEDLVQVLVGDHQRRDVARRSRPQVEKELLAVAELEQEAGRRLAAPLVRHARAAGDHPDLVLGQHLGTGVVNVAVRRNDIRALNDAAGGLRR